MLLKLSDITKSGMQPPHPLLLVSDAVPLKGLHRSSVVCSFVPGYRISKVCSWSISRYKRQELRYCVELLKVTQPLERSCPLKKKIHQPLIFYGNQRQGI